jgi:hypothetical protein
VKRIAEWWFAAAPAERLAALRIAIGLYALSWVVGRIPELRDLARLPAEHFRPVGVVRLLDAPLAPGAVVAIAAVTAALLAAFVVGAAFRVLAPLAALGRMWTLSYRNSWGMVFHTENLLVMHVLALAVTPAADVWALARRREPPPAGYGWAIKLLVALAAVTYLLAGIAKLRIAGTDWLDGEFLRNQIAIDNLRKALLGDHVAALATLFLEQPAVLTVFCVVTLVIELGAPFALLGGRVGWTWAAGAWGFHLAVVLTMNIWFPYPLFGFAFLPLFPVERVGQWVIQRIRGIRARLRG